MFCSQCGKELKEGALFCTNCGANQNPGNTADDLDKTMIIDSNLAGNGEKAAGYAEPPYQNGSGGNIGEKQNFYRAQSSGAQNQNYNDEAMRKGAPHIGVSSQEAVRLFFKNYVNFEGRASKSEYWWVFLFNIIVGIASFILSFFIPQISLLVSLGFLLPGLALYVRRMHDTGKPWYRIFMGLIPVAGPIIMIVDLCGDSDGDNQWGYGPYHK